MGRLGTRTSPLCLGWRGALNTALKGGARFYFGAARAT